MFEKAAAAVLFDGSAGAQEATFGSSAIAQDALIEAVLRFEPEQRGNVSFGVEELFGFVQAFVVAAQKPLGGGGTENEFTKGVAIGRVVADPSGLQRFPFSWIFVRQQQLSRGAAVRAGVLAGDGFAFFGFGTSGVLPGLVIGMLGFFLRRIWFAGHT